MNIATLVSLAALFFFTTLTAAFSSETANPYVELIDEPFPTSVAIVPIDTNSFHWVGLETLPAGTKLEFYPESTQWSRIRERIVLPRARIRIEIPGVDSAQIEVQSRLSPLRRSGSGGVSGEALVPLVTGAPSRVVVHMRKNGVDTLASVYLQRTSAQSDYFGIDRSCSPSGIQLSPHGNGTPNKRGGLVIVHCQIIRSDSADGMAAVLDLLLFVDGAGDSIRVNGVPTRAEAPSLFRLRLTTQSEPFVLETLSGGSFELKTKIPQKLNRGFFGLGIGPYSYRLTAPGTDVNTTTGILTVYGSYQLSESVRMILFNATAIHKNFFSDTGFYAKTDSVRFFDQKISVYLMLGANFVAYRYGSATHFDIGAPQGFEATYHDFFALNKSLTAGAFIYPPIDGKSYYNTWLRYGSSDFFLELNYLAIRTHIESASIYTKSAGASIGFPLAHFF